MLRFPAVSVEALLRGLKALGLDRAALERAAGLQGVDLRAPEATVAPEVLLRVWVEARRHIAREELPTEAGLAVPLGAFGVVDYMAGSAPTVAAGLCALRDHLRAIVSGLAFDLLPVEGGAWFRVVTAELEAEPQVAADLQEFTLAVTLGRFRVVTPDFRVDAITLTRAAPARETRHRELLGAPVSFGRATTAALLPRASLDAPMRTTDSALSRTLTSVASRLGIGGQPSLAATIRGQLPHLLAQGRLDARSLARSLGMSERTLNRRLAEAGTTYQRVVDAFRADQAERMLLEGRASSVQIAAALGFTDQTAFIRAFRRWKGSTPGAWVAERRGETSSAPGAASSTYAAPRGRRRRPR
jgi:AraC-like DNA-binding protein